MLRFFTLLLLRVCGCLTLVGALVSRPWGWSEYASPELYVVYYQVAAGGNRYFIVGGDGSDQGERLGWPSGVAGLDCSPDGRVFAFLDDDSHLYVMNAAGMLYDSAEDRPYTTVSVANDGSTALFAADTDVVRIHNAAGDYIAPIHPQYNQDLFDISAQGLVLWNQRFERVRVVAPDTGEVLASVARGHSGTWLASPDIFTYYDLVTDLDGLAIAGGQYVMDVRTQTVHRIGGWTISRPVSPDGMEVAAALVTEGTRGLAQIVVYNFWGVPQRRALTHDSEHASMPICFLTFHPEMLSAHSP